MDSMFYLITVTIILSIVGEYYFVRHKKHGHYELKDTATNLIMGVGMLIEKLIFAAWLYLPYSYFYQYRVFDLSKTWWVYLMLIFAEDYAYYWFHRISHESRFFWCSHETHHSSQRLNISTSTRQTWTGYLFSWVFWVPLVLLGFPPEWVLLQQSISLFYQIFIHTEAIKTLGFLEYFMNTPSHHRVHHAVNLKYLDKNYAGIFIIWDKIHHSFAQEVDTPKYGTSDPVNSYNPLRIAFHMWVKLAYDLRNTPGFINKLKTAFFAPGWRYDGRGRTAKQLQKLKLVG